MCFDRSPQGKACSYLLKKNALLSSSGTKEMVNSTINRRWLPKNYQNIYQNIETTNYIPKVVAPFLDFEASQILIEMYLLFHQFIVVSFLSKKKAGLNWRTIMLVSHDCLHMRFSFCLEMRFKIFIFCEKLPNHYHIESF